MKNLAIVCLLAISTAACQQHSENLSANTTPAAAPIAASSTTSGDVETNKYPQQVYWGDTHLHTSNSLDAFAFGNRLNSVEALRFARGEAVTSSTGMEAKLARPLDFLVIADHSDGLGSTRRLLEMPRSQIKDPLLLKWHDMMARDPMNGGQQVMGEMLGMAARGERPSSTATLMNADNFKSVWMEHTDAVERYNQPGKFTAFVGFEYSLQPKGNNLHRVVIYRDGKDKADQLLPLPSAMPGASAEQLWNYMDQYAQVTGGKMLAIPHNSNVSNGIMFELVGPDGGPMSAEYARKRAKHEPLVEATQIKGDSESHPFLSPNDEFASFGDTGWDKGNLTLTLAKENDMLAGEYVREALKRGLEIEARTGVNPFQLGMIGSTDSHTSLATADDDNFYNKHPGYEPNAERTTKPFDTGGRGDRLGWHFLASGYAAVWAKENTREALFDAMMRREVYASTGPRIKVRLFGGWDFQREDLSGNWVNAGYQRGVPMGGELHQQDKETAPSFLVSAIKDPIGANLDRIQMVKGWIDNAGQTHEKIFNIAWSDTEQRQANAAGKIPAVGSTVDEASASYSNNIGAVELQTVWQDPEFSPDQKAFYYLRVLEIPTPRWVLYDAVRYGAKLADSVERIQQARAYTSPIWYHPKG